VGLCKSAHREELFYETTRAFATWPGLNYVGLFIGLAIKYKQQKTWISHIIKAPMEKTTAKHAAVNISAPRLTCTLSDKFGLLAVFADQLLPGKVR
jgi:hypothetical protein